MKRHPVDATSLVSGLVMVAVSMLYLIGYALGWDIDQRWVIPMVLVGLGTAGLVGALTSALATSASAVPADTGVSAVDVRPDVD